MPELPTISVVVPSFNQAEYLEETLLSLFGQEYPHLEVIVMDGGSTDGSVEIIQRYTNQLHYWVSEPDEGQTDAIAKGFHYASGEILFWIASDDFLLPGALHAVAEAFGKEPKAEVVTGGCYYVNQQGAPITHWGNLTLGVSASYDRFRFYEQDGVSQQSTFFKREAYEAVGGLNRSLTFIMDLDLYTRLAQRRPFVRLPRLLAAFRIHDEAKSSTIQHIRLKEQEAFQEQHGVSTLSTPMRTLLYWRYRIPSLLRKIGLRVAQLLGSVTKPKACDAREWAAHHRR